MAPARAFRALAKPDPYAISRRWTSMVAAGLVTLLIILPACASPGSGHDAARYGVETAGLESMLAEQLDAIGVPGMSVAITHDDEVVYLGGFGSDGRGHPIDADTQFMIASLTKSFTAVAVLQLVERGTVELDAPVRRYLPEFTTADPPASGQITVRQLLNQTSGMADAGFKAGLTAHPDTLEDRVQDLRSARLVSEPGRSFHYFDPNYQVLARLVEVVTGRKFSSQLLDRVFAPARHDQHGGRRQRYDGG
jgi:CubicO group peptidase (beta-lactamase class C family)